MLSLLILVPLAALILLNLPLKEALRKWAFPLALAIALAQVGTVLFAPSSLRSASPFLEQLVSLTLQAGNLSLVLLLCIGIVMFTALLVAKPMIQGPRPWFNFINVLLISLIGMNGAVLVTDLFSLYVFLEVTSVASFVLIAFNRDRDALEGAFKYIVLSAVATVLMLTGVAMLMLMAGGTGFETVRLTLAGTHANLLAKIAVGGFVCGLFIKGGLVPFHGWLPGAYSAAPAPVSVLLAGIVTKVSGIYALVRLATSVFPPSGPLNHVLMLVGTVSIIVGALAALGQGDMKRMLAYSSISQVGYIVLALGCGTELAVVGAVFHLFNHAIFKSLLFVNSAALEQRLGTTDMNRMGGLGSRMPWTGVTSTVAALSTSGVPPFAGFWSKLIIIIALWKAQDYAYAWIAVLMSVVTLAYFLVLQRKVFFGKVSQELAEVHEASFALVFPAVVLAAITSGVGVLLPWMLDSFLLPLKTIL